MEKEKNKTLELVKNIILFLVANFIPKTITFFMLPLYTYCLTTSEYGTMDIMFTTVQLLLPFLTLQVQDAMLRFSMDKANTPGDVFTIGMRIACLGSLIFFLGCTIGKFTGIIEWNPLYLTILVLIFFSNAVKNISSYFCRGIDKVGVLTASNIFLTVIVVLCNVLFLVIFKWGVTGYLLATCLGNVFALIFQFFAAKLYKYIKWNVTNRELLKEIIYFSFPMVFSALAWWINSSLDKYILGYYYGMSAVGIIAVAYKIPSILSTLGNTIANAYSISAIKEFDINDSDGFLGKSYAVINMCFVIACSFIMIINVYVSSLLFSKEFFEAWKYVPPLLVSAVASQLSLTCEQYYIALKNTKVISVTAACGAVSNLSLNMILIPKYGAYGAAIATAASYFVTFVIRYVVLYIKFNLRLKHDLIAECVTYILLLLQLLFAQYGNKYILHQLIIFICIVSVYLIIFFRKIFKTNMKN